MAMMQMRSDAALTRSRLVAFEPFPAIGTVRKINAGEIEADGPDVSVGMQCEIFPDDPQFMPVRALAAAVSGSAVRLVPFGPVGSLKIGDKVRALRHAGLFGVGDAVAGRAIDALGRPIDGRVLSDLRPGVCEPLAILDRIAPNEVVATGLRAIDGLLTIGKGQRIGIFAASGVGKTNLIEQIIDCSQFDRAVICQVGERGREVEALWRRLSQTDKLAQTALVAATSDEAAPMRARAVDQALALAGWWRSQGEDVLLVVDSITRLAFALREIGLVAGEPPTARAYTPNVFRELPRIVESCGAARSGGSITALFTVLCETDDADDPLVEAMKSLLDGHIVLARDLAQVGHFPAVDVNRSISRLFDSLADPAQRAAARQCRSWLARYEESKILIESGIYKPGADRDLDTAIAARGSLSGFLRQLRDESSEFPATRDALIALAGAHG
ncbi:MAG: FliI/YscN family ATPase [Novosphingobium sp.]|uniref:FliI/YscN family ATPase n=1 Tax=Novosphingobium sp. TaxID=1874826 RepID=UPI0032B7565A